MGETPRLRSSNSSFSRISVCRPWSEKRIQFARSPEVCNVQIRAVSLLLWDGTRDEPAPNSQTRLTAFITQIQSHLVRPRASLHIKKNHKNAPIKSLHDQKHAKISIPLLLASQAKETLKGIISKSPHTPTISLQPALSYCWQQKSKKGREEKKNSRPGEREKWRNGRENKKFPIIQKNRSGRIEKGGGDRRTFLLDTDGSREKRNKKTPQRPWLASEAFKGSEEKEQGQGG